MKIKKVNEFVFCMCLYAFVLKFNSYWHDIIHLKTVRCKLNGGHRNCIHTPPPANKSFLWTRFGEKNSGSAYTNINDIGNNIFWRYYNVMI